MGSEWHVSVETVHHSEIEEMQTVQFTSLLRGCPYMGKMKRCILHGSNKCTCLANQTHHLQIFSLLYGRLDLLLEPSEWSGKTICTENSLFPDHCFHNILIPTNI